MLRLYVTLVSEVKLCYIDTAESVRTSDGGAEILRKKIANLSTEFLGGHFVFEPVLTRIRPSHNSTDFVSDTDAPVGRK